jgi:hypothetical protein
MSNFGPRPYITSVRKLNDFDDFNEDVFSRTTFDT